MNARSGHRTSDPVNLWLAPERAVLDVLKATLATARATLLAAHPVLAQLRRDVGRYRNLDPQSSLALGLVAQAGALEACIAHYASCTAAALQSQLDREPAF